MSNPEAKLRVTMRTEIRRTGQQWRSALQGNRILFHGLLQELPCNGWNTLVKITNYNPVNKKNYAARDTAWVSFDKEKIHLL